MKSGDRTLRAAIDEAIRDWVSDPDGTYYLLGSAIGPHPYPYLVRELQSVIGREARAQMLEAGGLPDAAFACVGGGSNAIGLFHGFLADRGVALSASRRAAAGRSSASTRRRCRTASPACCTARTRCCSTTSDGQIQETHSISAGLDYPGVGPEHALLQAIGRVEYIDGERRRGAGGARGVLRGAKAYCRRSRARTRSRARSAGPRASAARAC